MNGDGVAPRRLLARPRQCTHATYRLGVLLTLALLVACSQPRATLAPLTASPLPVGPIAYVGSLTGDLYALDTGTGRLRWRYASQLYTISTPAVAGGVAYATSRGGDVLALRGADGSLLWQQPLGTPFWSAAPPAIADGVLYTAGNAAGQDQGGAVYALDLADGRVRWRYATGGGFWAPPVARNGIVYAGCADGALYALRASDGALLWRSATSAVGASAITDAPAVSADGVVVYVVSAASGIFAFDAATGAPRWRYPIPPKTSASGPALAGDLVYSSIETFGAPDGSDGVVALDAADGHVRWRWDGPVAGRPLAAGGFVSAGSLTGVVTALDAADGAVRWQHREADTYWSVPALAEGTLYATAVQAPPANVTGQDLRFAASAIYALAPADGGVRWRYDTRGLGYAPVTVA